MAGTRITQPRAWGPMTGRRYGAFAGRDQLIPDTEGIEYHLNEGRMHYATTGRLHYRAAGPLHYQSLEDDG